MEERFKFRHVHAITGTFVLVVLAVPVAALMVAGRSQRWFVGNVPLQTVLPEEGAAGTLSNLRAASGNLQLASSNLPALSEAIGKEAKDLPGLVLQTQISMRELERLIEAMQRHWLLRKYVNWTNPPSLRPLPTCARPQQEAVKGLHAPKD